MSRRFTHAVVAALFGLLSVTVACEDPKSCSACNEAEGTQFCVACPNTDTCIASIENIETGEVLFSCEEAVGESCATDELVAQCPDA